MPYSVAVFRDPDNIQLELAHMATARSRIRRAITYSARPRAYPFNVHNLARSSKWIQGDTTMHQSTKHDRFLRCTAVLFAVVFVMHGLDHAERGMTGDDHHAVWPGSLQLVMGALTIAISSLILVLVFSGHRRAPVVATVTGFGVAAFFLLIHGLPNWAGFTDSFISAPSGARVTEYSWVTALMGILTALALGIAGLRTRGVR